LLCISEHNKPAVHCRWTKGINSQQIKALVMPNSS
jgi:hypothetical protein